MKLTRRARRPVLALAALALGAGALGGIGPAQAVPDRATGAGPAPLQMSKVADSVAYLRHTYGVSQAEALRRLELQRQAGELAPRLQRQLPGVINEVWLDQAGGGNLVIATTKAAQVKAALGSARHDSHIKVKPVRWSVPELEAAAAALAPTAKRQKASIAGIRIDARNGAVVVFYRGARTGPGYAAAKALRAGAGSLTGEIRIEAAPKHVPAKLKSACTVFMCDTPIRGGVRLDVKRDDRSWGGCTVGFNIRDSRNWAYILTAGHCVLGSDKAGVTDVYHNALPLAGEMYGDGRFARNDPIKFDYAALPFRSFGNTNWWEYWLTKRRFINLVHSECIPTNYQCGSGEFVVSGWRNWSDVQLGQVYCATGSGAADVYSWNQGYTPGTRCGQVQSKTYYSQERDSYWWESGRGIRLNICSRDGDSGGPLFDQTTGQGIGILSGGNDGDEDCYSGEPVEYSVYAPLSEIFADLQTRTGYSFRLITSTVW